MVVTLGCLRVVLCESGYRSGSGGVVAELAAWFRLHNGLERGKAVRIDRRAYFAPHDLEHAFDRHPIAIRTRRAQRVADVGGAEDPRQRWKIGIRDTAVV